METVKKQTIATEEQKSSILISLKNLTSYIPLIASLGSILLTSGVIIVNLYLGEFTDIHGFSVISSRYFTATIWFLLVFSIIFGYGFLARAFFLNHKWGRILQAVFAIVVPLTFAIGVLFDASTLRSELQLLIILIDITGVISWFIFAEYSVKQWIGDLKPDIENYKEQLSKLNISRIKGIVAIIFITVFYGSKGYLIFVRLMLILLGLLLLLTIFSNVLYPNIPQYLGGGRLFQAEFVFNSDQISQNLPISMITGTNRSQPVTIVSELNEGFLVQDPTQDSIFVINKNAIIGMIDSKVYP